ncbi:peptide deformylase [Coriobacterium glomerans PW2]|uniref:Peptide deformylase n=1 Tax=Coriobacterium glomerans (strain ATCC 49209 / DSM 20642 / JCM 10262 / PW2) TaxID=700015 RepID=F2N9T3_CORGP|nr:peptide deformylase [Coriobacterium glomerans]AEB07186.1 peptide deformylase [Coriobacterium glomerans PW2]
MEINGIVLSPDERLRRECAPIEEITPEIERLASHMKQEMFENAGCGLAAPQVGQTVQMIVIDTSYTSREDYDPYVLINPVIIEQSDRLTAFSEGCLSIPGISCEIYRPDHVVVEAYDLDANLIRYEAAGDLMCVCLQHEIDHLKGITMFERLDPAAHVIALRAYQDALARGAKPGETGAKPVETE